MPAYFLPLIASRPVSSSAARKKTLKSFLRNFGLTSLNVQSRRKVPSGNISLHSVQSHRRLYDFDANGTAVDACF